MFKSYLKIAWRNLFRNKGFSFTNILGLTIGITCAMLILLWVQNELTYDKFHKNYDNVYQVIANRNFNNQMFTDRSMAMPLASELDAEPIVCARFASRIVPVLPTVCSALNAATVMTATGIEVLMVRLVL